MSCRRTPRNWPRPAEDLAQAPGGGIETVAVNLYDPAAVDAFIQRIDGEGRHIKHLVNAAGAFKPLSFLEHGKSDYEEYMDLNRAFFFITQAVARNMKAHGGGAIVNIGSMWAKQAIKADPLFRLLDGQGRPPRHDPASCNGTR